MQGCWAVLNVSSMATTGRWWGRTMDSRMQSTEVGQRTDSGADGSDFFFEWMQALQGEGPPNSLSPWGAILAGFEPTLNPPPEPGKNL